DRLDRLGFSATRIGVWQDIEDLASFQLAGGAMRRLRYLVQRYEAQGRCETVEHTPGSDPVVDREIAAVMEEWAAARGVTPAFLAHMKKLVFSGAASTARHRTFLVRRNGVLDGVIFILPAPALARRRAPAGATSATVPGGYLMDVECYRPDAPLGCLELGITRIIRALQEEGATVLSLGLTPGALLAEHPGDDPEARSLFAKLHDEGLLNGRELPVQDQIPPAHGTLVPLPAARCRSRAPDGHHPSAGRPLQLRRPRRPGGCGAAG